MVLAFPTAAERLLTERRVPDPVLRHTLRAETTVRLNRPREAMTCASRAVHHAVQQEPPTAGRLLPAVTVLADAAVLAGAPDTIATCTDLIDLAHQFGDDHRATIGAGLHAVAVYHQRSCHEATDLLLRLVYDGDDTATRTAITLAQHSMDGCCARRNEPHRPPAVPPVITAGGLVQPTLTPAFLADRFQRWVGIHDCTPATSSARPTR
jgi:hypothetical protein